MSSRTIRDTIVLTLLLLALGSFLVFLDRANMAVLQSVGIGIFVVASSHVMRRLLFNALDLQKIAMAAVEDKNMAAALVFCTICLMLVAIAWLSMRVLV